MRNALKVMMVACLATALWQARPARQLQVTCTAELDRDTLVFLRSRGPELEWNELGFRLKNVPASLQALCALARYERTARDLCLENLANSKYVEILDEIPYRRRWARLRPDGRVVIESDRNVNWVYDPSNPNATSDGEHKGYVAMASVNSAFEARSLAAHETRLNGYLRALRKLELLNQNLVILDGANREPDAVSEAGLAWGVANIQSQEFSPETLVPTPKGRLLINLDTFK